MTNAMETVQTFNHHQVPESVGPDERFKIGQDAEARYLAALCWTPKSQLRADLLTGVHEEDFTDRRRALIFRAIKTQSLKGRMPESVSIRDWLETAGLLAEAGGALFVNGVLTAEGCELYAAEHRKVLLDLSLRRRLQYLASDLAEAANGAGLNDVLRRRMLKMISASIGHSGDGPLLILATDVQMRAVRWLWRNVFPFGKLSLLVGQPDVGKTTLIVDVAARVSRGEAFPGDETEATLPGGVIILTAEDDYDDTLKPRLHAAGADMTRIAFFDGIKRNGQEISITVSDIPALEAAIRAVPDCKVLIIDPLAAFYGMVKGNDNTEVRGMLGPLKKLASKTGIAIIAISHLRKADAGTAADRVIGSIAVVAAARSAWLACKDPNNPQRRLLLRIKCNVGAEIPGFAYQIDTVEIPDVGTATRTRWLSDRPADRADDILNPVRTYGSPQHDKAVEFIQSTLAAGAMDATEFIDLAKEQKIGLRTLNDAKKDAGAVSRKKKGFGNCWEWVLEGAPPGTG